MSLKQWGAVLTGCAALLLTACTVVDLDADGKPIMPADPNAKASFDNQTPQQIAQQTWQSRVLDAASQHAGCQCAEHAAENALFHAAKCLCPADRQD
jgi:predicted lipoprotein